MAAAAPGVTPLWRGLSRVVLTNTGSLRKQVTKTDGFPADQKQAKADVLRLIGEIGQTVCLVEQLAMLEREPDNPALDRRARLAFSVHPGCPQSPKLRGKRYITVPTGASRPDAPGA